jgi:PTS system nitrogen regulatory IIA component
VRLGSLTRPELIFPDLSAADRAAVLRVLAARLAGLGLVRNADDLFQKLWEREQLGSTGIGGGIAIPHCKIAGLREGIVAIGIVPAGVDFGAAEGQPVRLFFLVASPAEAPAAHLQMLAAISRWIKAGGHAERILDLHDPQAVYGFLQEAGV